MSDGQDINGLLFVMPSDTMCFFVKCMIHVAWLQGVLVSVQYLFCEVCWWNNF